MKQQIIDKLTSSKNERLAFGVIWDMTKGGTGSKIIRHADFVNAGLPHRNRRNEAVLRLIKKGLVFRFAEDMDHFRGDCQLYRYSVKNWGCVRFLAAHETPCIKCQKLVGI